MANAQVPTAEAEFAAGIAAGKKSDTDGALQHLQRAVVLDPKMTKAHFAIAAIADIWCSMNAPRCGLAIEEYKKVLELDSSRQDALKNLAYALYQVYRLDESESYYRKDLSLYGDDPDALGGIAAINFDRYWRDVGAAMAGLNVPAEIPLIYSPACHAVRDRNQARIEEGIALLIRALHARKNSIDVMGWLSTLHIARAEIQCGDRRAYNADMKAARTWVRMLRRTQKRKVESSVLQRCPPPPPPLPNDD